MNSNSRSPDSKSSAWQIPPAPAEGAHGLYNPTQFVVRLHPELEASLAGINSGVYTSGQLPAGVITAFGTYLHETVHWWQHVGSTLGLILSLSFPAQTHFNYALLRSLVKEIGPKKSLKRLDMLSPRGTLSGDTQGKLNRILNNWHDFEFSYLHIISPQDARVWVESPYFDSVGHSYEMLWGACVMMLAAGIDPTHEVLPDPMKWETGFHDLRRTKAPGFYYRSPVALPPLGGKQIFEGQARFTELQYLHFASGGALDWDDFRKTGMLRGIYQFAFRRFLSILGERHPLSIDSPLVGLFLLICELAINPTDGFPFDVRFHETFISDIDPGMRFFTLCLLVRDDYPSLKRLVVDYSRQEYVEGSEVLSHRLVCPSPLGTAAWFADRSKSHAGLRKLLEEDAEFQFTNFDFPVRVLFSRFLRFQVDKEKHPEFFTWPGAWSTGRGKRGQSLGEMLKVFNRNEPLFVASPHGEVRPRLLEGRSEAHIYETFNNFFASNLTYNLVRQWTAADGPFDFDFSWLMSSQTSAEDIRSWSASNMEHHFGHRPAEFEII